MSATLPPPSQANVLIVGLARNSGKAIAQDIERLERACRIFQRTQIFVVESDSSDDTPARLGHIAQRNPAFRFVSLGALRAKHPLRTDRIAQCRNRYLDELTAHPAYADVDYVVVADLDGINNLIDEQALASCWQTPVAWDMCAANRRNYYYDIWALRHPDWCPHDCWERFQRLRPQIGNENAYQMAILGPMVRIPATLPPIPVDSAFGGLAIYRKSALLSSRYVGLTASGEEICEHITLHKRMREAGHQLYINPAMVAGDKDEHVREKYVWRKWRRWGIEMKKRLKGLDGY